MYFKSKKATLLILGITAIACSRILFSLFDDPEGPNLLIVVGMAVFLYLASLTAYTFKAPIASLKRLLLAVAIQVAAVACLYFFLR